MPRLTSKQRSEAIGMLRANVTVLQVANHFNMPRICIWKLCERPTAAGDNGRPKAAGPCLVIYILKTACTFFVIKNDIEYMLQTF